MRSVDDILRGQDLRVENWRYEDGRPGLAITDPEDGNTYIVPLSELEELQKRGELSVEAFKKHDESIKKARND